MRLQALNVRDVYCANETGFQTYGTPFILRGVIAPRNTFVRTAEMFVLDEFDEMCIFELPEIYNKGVVKTTMFWLRRDTAPDPAVDPPTHTLKGVTRTTDDAFAVLVLSGLDQYNPLNGA